MSRDAVAPRYVGGQAVMEGVMMRGEATWAVAVRLPDGSIETRVHDAPRWAERWATVPLARGIASLGESLGLGIRALTWSAECQAPEDEQLSKPVLGITMTVGIVFFVALFILVPMLGARLLSGVVGGGSFGFHLTEGLLSIGIFLGYLAIIGRMADIRRVFQYHGAEHKAIAAYESGVPLTPESAQRFTTEHVRCGTNFLLTVLVIAIAVYTVIGRPALPVLVLSRIVLIPVIAALAYEVIRFAARHMDKRWVRTLMRPGLSLQRMTTREPDDSQVEVALVALRAVLTAEQQAEVAQRAERPVIQPRPAFGAG